MIKSKTTITNKLPLFVATLCCALLVACSQPDAGGKAERGKNLLLICLDTVRADIFFKLADMEKDALSPWEDRALVFRNAYAPSPWTVPSVATVFTGLEPAHHGAGLFDGLTGGILEAFPSKVKPGTPSIAIAAQDNDFDTGVITGSGWTAHINVGLTRGFEHTDFIDMPGWQADWRPLVDTWRDKHLPRAREKGGNFFHYIHTMEAHNWHFMDFYRFPGYEHKELVRDLPQQRREQLASLAPRNACLYQDSKICKSFVAYALAIQALREGIAETLGTLEREGLLDDTIVVVFSDHGTEIMDHLALWENEESRDISMAFGHGRTLYQELLNVPLLVWHPDKQAATIGQPVALTDVAPTVGRWLGIDFAPEGWDGRFLDDYLGGSSPEVERVIYGSAVSEGEQKLSALHGKDKAIWHLVSDKIEYFDLATDPEEQHSSQSDQLVLQFDGYLMDYVQRTPKKNIVKGELSDDQIRRLQSIGYLQGVEVESE